jgi:inosine/xanthosine triphosphate pyrophosphatase family protein/dephospho-CoA kinase
MSIPSRPTLRELFLSGERRLEVYFYTSNVPKFLHAYTVFARSGLVLKHFKSRTDPYTEDYRLGKERLLRNAIREIVGLIGKQSLLFVEDTSLRIEALSKVDADYPGLAVKEWFTNTSFDELDTELRRRGHERSAIIKSDIALHVPGLPRPLFIHGEVYGHVADAPPDFPENKQYPWLTPNTFNGWFIPEGADKRLGEMSLEESWQFDFRTRALESLLNRLEEYAAILNLPANAYSRPRRLAPSMQLRLFTETKPTLIIVGKICAGKSTFGEHVSLNHGLHWVEASQVLRTFKTQYDDDPVGDFDFARQILDAKGQDVVARKILELYSDRVTDGLVITGFRTIEELEAIRASIKHVQVILIEASERARFQRHLARGRVGSARSLQDFRAQDKSQWSFGLLRVAEEFADVRIVNEGTLDEYRQQIDFLLTNDLSKTFPGVSHRVHPRHGLAENQLYRCLVSLNDASRPLSCDEIQEMTARTGQVILHNNANKVLKRVPELAKRYELVGQRVRYDITNAGRAYIRYMKSRFETQSEKSSTTNAQVD